MRRSGLRVQRPGGSRGGRRALALLAVPLAWHGAVLSQEAGGPRVMSIQPSVSIQQVVTDNYRLSTPRAGDAITELGAGLRLAAQGSSLRGTLDYEITGLAYARHPDQNTFHHRLAASGRAELVEGSSYVEMGASVLEQAISTFGTLTVDGERPTNNKDRVTSLWIAPFVQGRVGSLFDYRASLRQETARFFERGELGLNRTSAAASLVGGGAPLSWTLDANHQQTRYRFGNLAKQSDASGTLRYQLGTDWRVGASAGLQWSEYAGESISGQKTYGLSANWIPSARTEVRFSADKQFFGTSHEVELKHRIDHFVVIFIDRRDLSTTGAQGLTETENLNQLVAQQFVRGTVNPVQVNFAAQDFLRANGVDPNAPVISGFLSSTLTDGRMQTLSAIWNGLRTTLSVRLAQGWTQQLQDVAGPITDFQLSRIVRQRGLVGDLAYNPTPTSTIGLNGTCAAQPAVTTRH